MADRTGRPAFESAARIPGAAHFVLAGWVATFLVLAEFRPFLYDGLLQEDRFVEWLTVALFGVAAGAALARAFRHRLLFDGLVGAFCVFVAGEEFSWGQRLLNIRPPETFLEHNRQQELTIHNFADFFGEPKWVLIAALVGYGLLSAAGWIAPRGRRLLARLGATAPPLALVPWWIGSAALLFVYPHPFTGEWVETLAGGLFLLAFMPSARAGVIGAGAGVLVALGLALVSGSPRGATSAELACARAEAEALVEDIAFGSAATGRLIGARSAHKRLYTAIDEGYLDPSRLESFAAAPCALDDVDERREHALDPWSSAYWIDLERDETGLRFKVYSFGPNRRRDRGGVAGADDDIVASVRVDPLGKVTRPVL